MGTVVGCQARIVVREPPKLPHVIAVGRPADRQAPRSRGCPVTTIAVARKNGVAAIGADTMSVVGDVKLTPRFVRNHFKLVPCGEATLAFTGSGPWHEILSELLADEANRAPFASVGEVFAWSRRLVEALRQAFRLAADDSETGPFENSHVQLLIASPAGIFGLHADRSVDEYERFFAFGDGGAVALGAMCAVYDRVEAAEEIVRIGLGCAGELQLATGQPGEVRAVKLRV
jgi:ATP-dependent protease HslVU (ClpYQ) peptidase subunit